MYVSEFPVPFGKERNMLSTYLMNITNERIEQKYSQYKRSKNQ